METPFSHLHNTFVGALIGAYKCHVTGNLQDNRNYVAFATLVDFADEFSSLAFVSHLIFPRQPQST